jgi:hypothetical protein
VTSVWQVANRSVDGSATELRREQNRDRVMQEIGQVDDRGDQLRLDRS